MKTLLILLLSIVVIGCGQQSTPTDLASNSDMISASTCAGAQLPYAGGTGTLSDPYLICNSAQLNQITINEDYDKAFKVMSDIDFSGHHYIPIGAPYGHAFNGLFDGNGYTITNITIKTEEEYSGFFREVGANAVVKNIRLTNILINSAANLTGILVGNNMGMIWTCDFYRFLYR